MSVTDPLHRKAEEILAVEEEMLRLNSKKARLYAGAGLKKYRKALKEKVQALRAARASFGKADKNKQDGELA
jgi:hypothetical protein